MHDCLRPATQKIYSWGIDLYPLMTQQVGLSAWPQELGQMELQLQQFLAFLHFECLLTASTIRNYLAGLRLEMVSWRYLWTPWTQF